MNEERLKQYFEKKISAQDLNLNLIGAAKAGGSRATAFHIINMDEKFEVMPEHIIQLCKDVINGLIEPQHLEPVAFCLIGSDNFYFRSITDQDEEMKGIISEWASPKIN